MVIAEETSSEFDDVSECVPNETAVIMPETHCTNVTLAEVESKFKMFYT